MLRSSELNWVLEIKHWAGKVAIHLIFNLRIIPLVYVQYLQVNPIIFPLELAVK